MREIAIAIDILIPILPSRSIPATVAFYQRLGFKVGAHEYNAGYAILRMGTIELHFFEHPTLVPEDPFAGCYMRVANVKSIYDSFKSSKLPTAGIPRILQLEDKPWGLREFVIVDIDGNLLRVGEVIDE